MESRAPLVVQVDLDSLSSHAASYTGRRLPPSTEEPVYLLALPRCLELFRSLRLRATFFAVGEDLAQASSAAVLRSALAEGHEIGNHSYSHPLGLSNCTAASIRQEIAAAHEAIRRGLGVEAKGFRSPGWDISALVLATLVDLGYLYDSSVLPSWFGTAQNVALKLISFLHAPAGGGSWRFAYAPSSPYFPDVSRPWRAGTQRHLLEIPAGVVPGSRLPYSATVQLALGESLLAHGLPRLGSRPLVYVLHGIDFLDRHEIDPSARRHPTAAYPLAWKYQAIRRLLSESARTRRSLSSAELAMEMFATLGGKRE